MNTDVKVQQKIDMLNALLLKLTTLEGICMILTHSKKASIEKVGIGCGANDKDIKGRFIIDREVMEGCSLIEGIIKYRDKIKEL
jgi:hypothetical protein